MAPCGFASVVAVRYTIFGASNDERAARTDKLLR